MTQKTSYPNWSLKDLHWNEELQTLANQSGVQLAVFQATPLNLQKLTALTLRLTLHGSQSALLTMLTKLMTKEMPLILTHMQITAQKNEILTLEMSLLFIKQFALKPVNIPIATKQQPLFCNTMTPQATAIPLQSFTMRGFLMQGGKRQALLSAGWNLTKVVQVGDVFSDERARVTFISPQTVRVELPTHAMLNLRMA